MKIDYMDEFQYIKFVQGKANIIFFTAYNDADFNMMSDNFTNNINKVQEMFCLRDVGYSKQVHGDVINIYDGLVKCGDAILTKEKRVAIGVFTADCVPVIIYDGARDLCAAVHSGWKGTYSQISYSTINKMLQEFGSKAEDISVYIGPHMRCCCYEVGQELIDKFTSDDLYKSDEIIVDRKLNLAKCIELQCIKAGVSKDKIYDVNLCTGCSERTSGIKLHSYRRRKEQSGRLFSLVYMDE
ncbi:peptidoglycan editing factor PgeF [Clostridium thermarum]|uniref:peptidoglycan editing factor PgeF n=1 Tax=Clostridium thermarum TaxID=1716543 RepID=UPI0013D00D37|nr:peptidoglycan editing factor PgeF [Clostridium thermarum]